MMTDKKNKKARVRDLKPSNDAKGGTARQSGRAQSDGRSTAGRARPDGRIIIMK